MITLHDASDNHDDDDRLFVYHSAISASKGFGKSKSVYNKVSFVFSSSSSVSSLNAVSLLSTYTNTHAA